MKIWQVVRIPDSWKYQAANAIRLGILLLPSGILMVAALRHPGSNSTMLWIGTLFQLIVCGLTFLSRQSWRAPLGPSVVTLYLIALAWLWLGDGRDDWYTHFTKAVLLVVPLTVFAQQTLSESGATAIRQARLLAARLAQRKEWPSDLAACRQLPEVKALRAALSIDASPALALLTHQRVEVRVAALASLEYRKNWRPGQAELVLQTAQRAEQPTIRAAAVYALANVDEQPLVEAMAQFLHDPSFEVRKAAAEALLWDTDQRWPWIRYAVRRVLADPLFESDGPLGHNGESLTPEAVKDLTAWCAEKGLLAARAAITLGDHHSRMLADHSNRGDVEQLCQQLADSRTPAVLRIELGKALHQNGALAFDLFTKLLAASNPAPLRLIAVEGILMEHADGPQHGSAVAALRDLARLPNREIALATAEVIQRRLGVDLGLGLGQPMPPTHSRQAAEITRRVMLWASQFEEDLEDSRPVAQPR